MKTTPDVPVTVQYLDEKIERLKGIAQKTSVAIASGVDSIGTTILLMKMRALNDQIAACEKERYELLSGSATDEPIP